jgi:UTP--glucose-1-phosphate uridylyltransferase
MGFVKRGVIPAAGLGTRFLPASKAIPKEMLPLVDKPAIQFAVEEAIASGVDDLVFVTGRGKHVIEDHFDRSHELESVLAERGRHRLLGLVKQLSDLCRVAYTRQKRPDGLGAAVACAEKLLGDETFAVLLADDILLAPKPVVRQLADVHEATGASVIAVRRVPREQLPAYGVIAAGECHDGVHEVTDLIEKPRPGRAPSELAIIGRYVLEPHVHDHLARTTPGENGEIQLTDALRSLSRERRVLALEFEGKRHDTGSKLGYVKATVELALERDDIGPELRAWLKQI